MSGCFDAFHPTLQQLFHRIVVDRRCADHEIAPPQNHKACLEEETPRRLARLCVKSGNSFGARTGFQCLVKPRGNSLSSGLRQGVEKIEMTACFEIPESKKLSVLADGN